MVGEQDSYFDRDAGNSVFTEFCKAIDFKNIGPDSDIWRILISRAGIFRDLKPGESMKQNFFSLNPVDKDFPTNDLESTDAESVFVSGEDLYYKHGGLVFRLKIDTRDASGTFLEDYSGDSIVIKFRNDKGMIKGLKTRMLSKSELEEETYAIQTLAAAGYPVVTGLQRCNYIFPWEDGFTFDWDPGLAIEEALMKEVREGNFANVLRIIELFARNIRTVWADLLEGRRVLEGGSTYVMPDNAFGNFVYNPDGGEREFVRIDIVALSKGKNIGLERFSNTVFRDIKFLEIPEDLKNKMKEVFSQALFD